MFHIIKNNRLYTSSNQSVLKGIPNCYLIRNAGVPANPFIIYYKVRNSKKKKNYEIIGSYKDMVEFLLENDENTFVITNFSRAGIAGIFKAYIEIKIQNEKNVSDSKKLEKKNDIQ